MQQYGLKLNIKNRQAVLPSSGTHHINPNVVNKVSSANFNYSRGYQQRGRRFVYSPVDDDRNLLEEKARNCVIKNLPEDPNEEVTRVNNLKLGQSILSEANIDVNKVIKVERHPARVPGRSDIVGH